MAGAQGNEGGNVMEGEDQVWTAVRLAVEAEFAGGAAISGSMRVEIQCSVC
jgi:hypothetical protein